MLRSITITALVATSALAFPAGKDVPVFSDNYSAKGLILLPYAELREPFDAYFDKSNQKSRIDYYHGEMKTIQNANTNEFKTGSTFKVVWSPNNKTHVPENTCYQANGTDPAGGAVKIQSVLPDLTGFTFAGTEACFVDGKDQCDKFVNTATNYNRSSTYTFWALKDGDNYIPKRYQMMGYNTLFGSHYDKYVVIYDEYKPGKVNGDVFNVSTLAKKCIAYPDGSGLSTDHLFNPMKEFVHHDESHLDEHFDAFKNTHDKQYSHATEHELRKNHFRHNLRFINSQNRRKLSYSLGVNHFADHSKEELKVMLGKRPSKNGVSHAKGFQHAKFTQKMPASFDWRLRGAVTPVKDQAICGSCWSFGTVAHIEGQWFLKNKKLVKFSEQQLVDCSWNEGNGACDGGEDFQAYNYIMKYGLATDDQYGAYKGIDGKCHDTNITDEPIVKLAGYHNVTSGSVEDLKKAIYHVGPISVGIQVIESMVFYNNGIFSDKDCKNGPKDLNHAVLAVGYGDINGEGYIYIKNSWSTYWGNDGYMLLAQKGNMCGVATAATYVDLP